MNKALQTTIIIFAKAPESGFAKTRLIPALGAQGAADFAQRMLNHAANQAAGARLGPVFMATTPNQNHPVFNALATQHQLTLIDQGDGDLGQRMQTAFDTAWNHEPNHPILLMGSDIPAIDAAMLNDAARQLQRCDAVFIPTFDGGYALVGLKKSSPTLFTEMTWSHPQVMQITRNKAERIGLHCDELAPVHDIDEPEDLQHWTP